MRLAAVVKLGYYPAAPEAVAGILKHLRISAHKPEDQFILDPCAGEGLAVRQLAEGLGIPFQQTYAVELDLQRSERIKQNVPEINLLGPASFLGVQVSGSSFGLVYCNPPFDTELGGGRREEQAFAQRATQMLVPKGILVLVCPMATLIGNRQFVQFLDSSYEDIEVYRFPDGISASTGQPVRPYNEVVLFGRKRKTQLPKDATEKHGVLHQREWQWRSYIQIDSIPPLGHPQPQYWTGGKPSDQRRDRLEMWEIPHGWKPNVFKKTQFTDEELFSVLDESPLNVHFRDVSPLPLKRPPLPLDKGHLGLILASGMLDGVVEGPHGPHVVRGSSTKIEYHNKELSNSEENPETGAVTTKDVYSQRMITIIRCADRDGTLYTFSNAPKEEGDGDDPLEG